MSAAAPRRLHRTRRLLRAAWLTFAWVAALAVIACGAFVLHTFRQAGITVEQIPALTDPARAPLPQPMRFVSADGHLLGVVESEKRQVISCRQVPHVMRQATVAIEDQRFYEHRGIDMQAIVRAAWVDLRAGHAAQGASTITQQYVRNVYLNFAKTTHRKLQEIALALQLESQWTKDRILCGGYLQTVAYGNGTYGVQAASRHYFGKGASQLRLPEAALLAGLTQQPENLDPRRHRARAIARQHQVLDEMYAQAMITRRQLLAAKSEKLRIVPVRKAKLPPEPALLEYARRELAGTVDAETLHRGGLTVTTSFDLGKIRRARSQLRSVYGPSRKAPVIAAAFVDPRTGRVRVLAHTRGGFFDFASQGTRQPGSTVKAFTAAAYLQSGGQLADPIDNSPLQVRSKSGTYTVQPTHQADRIADALRFSQNPAFWRLYQKVGPRKVLALQRHLGMRHMDANAAAALGGVRKGTNPLELAAAYGAFANDGVYARPHAVVKVADTLGNVVYRDRPRTSRRLESEYARQLNVAMRRVVGDGLLPLRASLTLARSRQLAGKTGTTEDNADAWFAGYTPQLSGAVWTGYANSRHPLRDPQGREVFGMTVPARAFNALAGDLLRGEPKLTFPAPRGLQRIPAVRGRHVDAARATFARFGLTGVQYVPKVTVRYKPGAVISVSPKAGTWVRPSTLVRVEYALNQRPMPDLVGRSYLDAVRQFGRFAKFTVKVSPSDQPTGTIIGQYPYAGTAVDAGSKVTVTLATERAPAIVKVKKERYVPSDSELASLRRQLRAAQARADASATVPVPRVEDLTVSQARDVLESLGLQVTVSGAPSGQVLRQTPPPGSAAQSGDTVTLVGG